jgi:hypothetical protein
LFSDTAHDREQNLLRALSPGVGKLLLQYTQNLNGMALHLSASFFRSDLALLLYVTEQDREQNFFWLSPESDAEHSAQSLEPTGGIEPKPSPAYEAGVLPLHYAG